MPICPPDDSPFAPGDGAGVETNASAAGQLCGLTCLCAVARFHHIAADPANLAHQLGLAPSADVIPQDLLRAAKHLGLKAKLSKTTADRLALTPLPALAFMRGPSNSSKTVILAQTDGQRVLLQDPAAPGGRPTIEPMDVFIQHWTGELILITSQASLAGDLAKFDFSWFISSLVKDARRNSLRMGVGQVGMSYKAHFAVQ